MSHAKFKIAKIFQVIGLVQVVRMAFNRFIRLFSFVVIFHLAFCVNYMDSFHTQRQRYASRMLKITPRACNSPEFPDLVGICMISLECQQRGGTVIAACRDGHLFGACCHDPMATGQPSTTSPSAPSTEYSTRATTTTTTALPSTTTTTMTTTTTTPTTTTTTTTTTEEPLIISNDISSDISVEADSTSIPSLIDTFSELSPTFLSELALDEHTTGMYNSGRDILSVRINGVNQISNEIVSSGHDKEIDDSNTNAHDYATTTTQTSSLTESATPKSQIMTSSELPLLSFSFSSSPSSESFVENESMGLPEFSQPDSGFKSNMIKYVDDIVTMRSNNEMLSADDNPFAITNDSPEIKNILSSTSKEYLEYSSPSMWPSSTTGNSNELSTTTATSATASSAQTPSTTNTPNLYSPLSLLPSFPPSIFTNENAIPAGPVTESAESTATDNILSTSIRSSSVEGPTAFTFSKLKYTPRPYRPRSTTEKVVWTRPTATAPEAFDGKPVVDFDPESEYSQENANEHEDNLVTSSVSSDISDFSSTEMMYTTMSAESSSSPYSLIPAVTEYDNLRDTGYENFHGHYLEDGNNEPSSFYTAPPTASSSSMSMSTSESASEIDWTSPAVISYLKGASENLESLFYGNISRSDLNGLLSSVSANEITAPSTGHSTTLTSVGPTSYSSIASGSGSGAETSPSAPSTASDDLASPSTYGSSTFSSSPISSTAPSASLWDSSIDAFVDQVVEGIVHDLNKSSNIDAMIFNNNNKNAKGSASKKQSGAILDKKVSKLPSSSTPSSALKLSSLKSKLKSSLIKSQPKKAPSSVAPQVLKSPSKEPSSVPSTISNEKLKLNVKAPPSASKRKINKNKAKPIKKVTTAKSPNSTRKRLNYKRDCGVRPLMKKGRIVGGTPSRFGSWPWHVLVKETVWWGIFSKIKCGGVLIGPQHVLTAAHCQPQQTGTLSVVLGITDSDDADSRAITKTIRRVIPHPQFNPRTYENDIAILELESPVDFQPHVVPICLPRNDDELEGKTAYVTGMGLLKHDGERPLVLQEVDLPILNNTECQKMFKRSGNKKPIIESFICAGYEQGRKDSCGGDSGGPLSVMRPNGQWVLAGTVSHGIKCALPDQPGVYMRTSYYKPWIDRVLSVARSRYRGIPKCNAPPMICARQRQHQQQLRQQQGHSETGFVNTLFRIFRLARKMVDEGRSRQ